MPKLGMQPIRRDALIKATIEQIGEKGTTDVTVAQIARAAGMSSALAHHYFGSKSDILVAAMRQILRTYGDLVRDALVQAQTPHERVQAIIFASFAQPNFDRTHVVAWMNFYVLANVEPRAARLLRVYQRRLRSNLAAHLRPLSGARAMDVAKRLAALIDGLYLYHSLRAEAPNGARAAEHVNAALRAELALCAS